MWKKKRSNVTIHDVLAFCLRVQKPFELREKKLSMLYDYSARNYNENSLKESLE